MLGIDGVVEQTIRKKLVFEGRCPRDCDRDLLFREVAKLTRGVVGVYECSNGHVLRVVYLDREPDRDLFKRLLRKIMCSDLSVEDKDIRVATRYLWDLDIKEIDFLNPKIKLDEILDNYGLRQLYWSAPRMDASSVRIASFLCSGQGGCRKIFVQDSSSQNRLCSNCSRN